MRLSYLDPVCGIKVEAKTDRSTAAGWMASRAAQQGSTQVPELEWE